VDMRKTILKDAGALLVVAILVSTAIFVFTPMARLAKAGQIGQIKVQEGFEFAFPPTGWTIVGPASIIQTTGHPGGECQIGYHAAKMFSTGNRFFVQMGTPTFNGKKGGGNILTFWHKQLSSNNHQDQLFVFVTNDLVNYVQITGYTSSMDWTYETINLDSFIKPTKTMQVWFIAILNYGNGVYLDEVTITGVSGY